MDANRPRALKETNEPPPLESNKASARVHEYLAFRLGGESYALPLSSVLEILRPPAITDVPRAPRDIIGVISVRGSITTIIDLRRRLRVADPPPDRQARVLLTRRKDEVVGLLVDAVKQVHRLLDDEIELRSAMSGDTADYIYGIGRPRVDDPRESPKQPSVARPEPDQDMLILLDIEALMRL